MSVRKVINTEMNNVSTFAENIGRLRLSMDKTQGEFAEIIGVKRGALAQYEAGNNRPKVNVIDRLLELAGVTLEEFENKPYKSNNVITKQSGLPVYDAVATGSALENVSQLNGQPLFYLSLPGYEDCSMGVYHYNHSMYPTIESGNLLLLKPVNDKAVIMYGEIYLIHTMDYFMVKRLQKSEDKKCVLCTSDNFEKRAENYKRFEPFDLERDKIITLYIVKGIIRKTQT